jgi:hypothetical protein
MLIYGKQINYIYFIVSKYKMSLLNKLKKKRQEESESFSSANNESESEYDFRDLEKSLNGEKSELTVEELFSQMDFVKEMESGKQHKIQTDTLNKFRKWKLSKNDAKIENTCINKSKILTPTIYQDFIRNYYKTYKHKGILLYNSVGSGKTFSSILMAIEGLKLKVFKKVIVLLPASLKVNYLDHITEYKDKFEILSYNTVSIMTKLPKLDDTLVIIDECQNLTSMITNGSSIGIFMYRQLYNAKCRIIAMSATPIINNTYEYVSLFNLLKPDTFRFDILDWQTTFYNDSSKMINKKMFYDKINGLVSYYQGANEDSEVFPSHTVNVVELTMNKYQSDAYNVVRNIEIAKEKIRKGGKAYISERNIAFNFANPKKIGDFKVKSRQACNFVYPYPKSSTSDLDKTDLVDNLHHYSIKFVSIINSIKQCNGVVMVYTYFVDNCLLVLKAALDFHGITSIGWIGGMSDSDRRFTLERFNHPKNSDGSRIKVILVSSAGAEGISLKNVQQVHIIEPHWNEIKVKQVIGRAIRICSHFTLPKERQHVNVYRYIAKDVQGETSDQHVFKVSIDKYATDREFDAVVKSSAFDCMLNKQQNVDVDECIEEHFS